MDVTASLLATYAIRVLTSGQINTTSRQKERNFVRDSLSSPIARMVRQAKEFQTEISSQDLVDELSATSRVAVVAMRVLMEFDAFSRDGCGNVAIINFVSGFFILPNDLDKNW